MRRPQRDLMQGIKVRSRWSIRARVVVALTLAAICCWFAVLYSYMTTTVDLPEFKTINDRKYHRKGHRKKHNIIETKKEPGIVRSKRDKFTPIPITNRYLYLAEGKGKSHANKAFKDEGWNETLKMEQAHIYHRLRGVAKRDFFILLKPWQKYSRVPGTNHWESKDAFLAGFQRYQKLKHLSNHDLHFLPETYRLKNGTEDKTIFRKMLNSGVILNRPWVLKKVDLNNGAGIEMLGPNSTELKTCIDRADADTNNTYIVQAYICNELSWFQGEKFDLRFYWMVASVDPLIVLYHDGYVRVGGAKYNESDFSTTGQHLTNHAYRTTDQTNVTSSDLWLRVREHYQTHKDELSPRIEDPVQHIRNQIKEALGTFIEAFQSVFPAQRRNMRPENLFGFFGADFVIDNDLDVYFIEAQASPGVPSREPFQKEMYNKLFRTMIAVVDEITTKQQSDATANLLPLNHAGEWEIVYADGWHYVYYDYEPPESKKGCSL